MDLDKFEKIERCAKIFLKLPRKLQEEIRDTIVDALGGNELVFLCNGMIKIMKSSNQDLNEIKHFRSGFLTILSIYYFQGRLIFRTEE